MLPRCLKFISTAWKAASTPAISFTASNSSSWTERWWRSWLEPWGKHHDWQLCLSQGTVWYSSMWADLEIKHGRDSAWTFISLDIDLLSRETLPHRISVPRMFLNPAGSFWSLHQSCCPGLPPAWCWESPLAKKKLESLETGEWRLSWPGWC